MKIIVSILLIIFPIHMYARSCSTNTFTVPFSNITLNPHCSLIANYSFKNNNVLFCYAGAAISAGILYWPYKGSTLSGLMPLTLKTSTQYQGFFADKSGTLRVSNNTQAALPMSCYLAI